MQELFININGDLIQEEKPVLKIKNRAFCYGDALFETMLWHNNKILFLEDHIERLFRGMKILKMEAPQLFSADYFQKQIAGLILKNKFEGDARVRLQVFRNDGGYYTPTNNLAGYVISAEQLNSSGYKLNDTGLLIEIFTELKKPANPLSNFKNSNSLIYVLAGIYAKEKQLDDCLILNTDEKIVDATGSNVFIVKDKIITTPPLSDGCVDGIMRKNLLRLLKNETYRVEEKSVSEKEILNADEVFITNAVSGIRWVGKFREKKYQNVFSTFLYEKLLLLVG